MWWGDDDDVMGRFGDRTSIHWAATARTHCYRDCRLKDRSQPSKEKYSVGSLRLKLTISGKLPDVILIASSTESDKVSLSGQMTNVITTCLRTTYNDAHLALNFILSDKNNLPEYYLRPCLVLARKPKH
jgi:hypothetical protein